METEEHNPKALLYNGVINKYMYRGAEGKIIADGESHAMNKLVPNSLNLLT